MSPESYDPAAIRPPLFIRLSNADRRLAFLVTPSGEGQPRLSGSWWGEVTAPGGWRTAGRMTFRDDVPASDTYAMTARMFGEGGDPMRLWDPAEPEAAPDWDAFEILRLKSFDDADGDATTRAGDRGSWTRSGEYPYAFWRSERRVFVQVATEDRSCIAAVNDGDDIGFRFVKLSGNELPTITVARRRDLLSAYRSFIRQGHHDAAYAVGLQMLRGVEAAELAEAITQRTLIGAAEATIRFPEIRREEKRLGELLARRCDEIIDLRALAWARCFDSDPAPAKVFEGDLDLLIERLIDEPPAYSETVRILFERIATAADIRADLDPRTAPAVRLAECRIRGLADATLWDREELTFEGRSPLQPERTERPVRTPKAKPRADPSPGMAGF